MADVRDWWNGMEMEDRMVVKRRSGMLGAIDSRWFALCDPDRECLILYRLAELRANGHGHVGFQPYSGNLIGNLIDLVEKAEEDAA